MKRKNGRRGSAIVEFTLVGSIFLMVWIYVIETGIGMWQYHTIQYAVKRAGSYAALHGASCTQAGNSCGVQIKNIATYLKNDLIGIDPKQVTVTLNALQNDHQTIGNTVTCQLSGGNSPCDTNTTAWPPSPYNIPGCDVEIKTEYKLQTALASVWLPGFTHQEILF